MLHKKTLLPLKIFFIYERRALAVQTLAFTIKISTITYSSSKDSK